MNPDGTPETHMEAWLLDMGLGFAYATTTDEDLTRAQAEALADSTPNPDENPRHDWLVGELASHRGSPRAVRNELEDVLQE